MAGDTISGVIEAIHEAGLDAEQWPRALASMMRLIGGTSATLEVIDRSTFTHLAFYGAGVDAAEEVSYRDHYAALNPRIGAVLRCKPGETLSDYRVLDEAAIDRSPFYMEFLAPMDIRYFIAGVLPTVGTEFCGFTIQRTARQGHVNRSETSLAESLIPHFAQAIDVERRLRGANDARHSLEQAFDWLSDGVVLVHEGGRVNYVNQAFERIAVANDGICLKGGFLEFAAITDSKRLEVALASLQNLRDGDARGCGCDFHVSRRSGAPAYLVSVRALLGERGARVGDMRAVAAIFIRDPAAVSGEGWRIFRDVLGLTEAEALLAQSLQHGVSPVRYAQLNAVSINTVYTHLRRIKEKTSCHRMADLIRKLNALCMPLLDHRSGDPRRAD
jgi:DNA-binding CsgD family transcriptional regulator